MKGLQGVYQGLQEPQSPRNGPQKALEGLTGKGYRCPLERDLLFLSSSPLPLSVRVTVVSLFGLFLGIIKILS